MILVYLQDFVWHDWMHRWRNALRAHRLPVTQMAGIPIHALRMMSFLAYLMLKAKKRLSTGLWRVWNNRNTVAFHRLIDSYLACLCLC